MMPGVLTAMLMLVMFLLEQAVLSTLPLPWRLLPVALILGLAIMHRVSFELGAMFVFCFACAMALSGLAPISSVVVVALSLVAAYGLQTRIFASRSLIAFTGFAFATTLFYFFCRFIILTPVPRFFPWMFLFAASTSALLALIASIGLNAGMSGFGRRFVRKAESYEVRAERA